MSRIVTSYVHPPIPCRNHDWCAYQEADVENASRYGWGASEAEAIKDLKQLLNEGEH